MYTPRGQSLPSDLVRIGTLCGLLVLLASAGCTGRRRVVETFCNAPRDCVACNQGPLDGRAVAYVRWTEAEVGEYPMATVLGGLAALSSRERSPWLRRLARSEGLTSCPMADHYEETARMPSD